MKKYVCCLLCLLFILPASVYAEEERKIAIVIDDFGNNMKGTEEMLSLPIPLTIAVMPFLPSTKQDAEMAHKKGYEVLVHLPMEPIRGKKSWLGPNAITTDLSDEEIKKRVEMAVADVPYAVGMNNHMGSKATADKRVMRIVLAVCKARGLFYLDSKTNPSSKVREVAEELGVPVIENNLFFDDQYTNSHIAKQASLLLKRVKTAPTTIAIGHVGPPGEITSRIIRTTVVKAKQDATFVFASNLVKAQK